MKVNGMRVYGLVETFPNGEDSSKHLKGNVDCPCHPSVETVDESLSPGSGTIIDWLERPISCVLRHDRILPKTNFSSVTGGNMQLFDSENQYQIQDAVARMPEMSMKGKFSADTARLLYNQIENMYDPKDLEFDR